MAALMLYFKIKPQIALPLGLLLDITVAYIIAQFIRSFQ